MRRFGFLAALSSFAAAPVALKNRSAAHIPVPHPGMKPRGRWSPGMTYTVTGQIAYFSGDGLYVFDGSEMRKIG